MKIFLKPVTNYINPLLSKTSKQQITPKETQKSLNNPFLHLLLVHCKITCLLPFLPFKPKPRKEYTAETKIIDCEPSCKDTQAKPRKKPTPESSTETGSTTKNNRFQPHPFLAVLTPNPQRFQLPIDNFMLQSSATTPQHFSFITQKLASTARESADSTTQLTQSHRTNIFGTKPRKPTTQKQQNMPRGDQISA